MLKAFSEDVVYVFSCFCNIPIRWRHSSDLIRTRYVRGCQGVLWMWWWGPFSCQMAQWFWFFRHRVHSAHKWGTLVAENRVLRNWSTADLQLRHHVHSIAPLNWPCSCSGKVHWVFNVFCFSPNEINITLNHEMPIATSGRSNFQFCRHQVIFLRHPTRWVPPIISWGKKT